MIGVIDIGSNSVRLMLIADNYKRKFTTTTGLGKGSLNGYLQQDSIKSTISAVSGYVDMARENNATDIYIFATEAVRSSKNQDEFCKAVKENTGIDIIVVPAEREAEMGFRGAYTEGTCLVLDIGGASTEIVVGSSDKILYKKSVPIGIVRISDKVKSGIRAEDYISEMLKGFGDIPKADNYYAIGGTASSIVAINEELVPYDTNKVHLYTLAKNVVDSWQQRLDKMSVEEIRRLKGIDTKRAEVIGGGAKLLLNIMNMLNIDSISVSENDNLEGFLYCYNVEVK